MKLTVREIALSALFIALITAGAFIRIPVGTDVYTLQFLFTLLAGIILGARLGALCVGAYVIMGLIGIPVFAVGGGFGYLLQPTFGYLLGFILQAWVVGKLARRPGKAATFRRLLAVNLVGMAIVYAIGITWFYLASNYLIDAPIALWAAIFYCGILQLPPDIFLCIGAAIMGERCKKAGIWL